MMLIGGRRSEAVTRKDEELRLLHDQMLALTASCANATITTATAATPLPLTTEAKNSYEGATEIKGTANEITERKKAVGITSPGIKRKQEELDSPPLEPQPARLSNAQMYSQSAPTPAPASPRTSPRKSQQQRLTTNKNKPVTPSRTHQEHGSGCPCCGEAAYGLMVGSLELLLTY
mmetsp:Transcript_29283/g.49428  ORF Transcript_29283/g.49428 Transcript_29283/m.49428 type:complete len:176 (+) Transcript_29283:595-1122(+)